jgi:hypothetical protein
VARKALRGEQGPVWRARPRKGMDNDSFDSIKVYIEDDAPSLLDMRVSLANTSENFFSYAQRTAMIASVAIGATRLTRPIQHAAGGMNPSPEDIYFGRIATEIELHELHIVHIVKRKPPAQSRYGSRWRTGNQSFGTSSSVSWSPYTPLIL